MVRLCPKHTGAKGYMNIPYIPIEPDLTDLQTNVPDGTKYPAYLNVGFLNFFRRMDLWGMYVRRISIIEVVRMYRYLTNPEPKRIRRMDKYH